MSSTTNQLDVEFKSSFDDVIRKDKINKLNELAALATHVDSESGKAAAVQNLSLKDVLSNTVQTCIDILQDFTDKKKPFFEILVGNNRAFYVGIILTIFSLSIWILSL